MPRLSVANAPMDRSFNVSTSVSGTTPSRSSTSRFFSKTMTWMEAFGYRLFKYENIGRASTRLPISDSRRARIRFGGSAAGRLRRRRSTRDNRAQTGTPTKRSIFR